MTAENAAGRIRNRESRAIGLETANDVSGSRRDRRYLKSRCEIRGEVAASPMSRGIGDDTDGCKTWDLPGSASARRWIQPSHSCSGLEQGNQRWQ